MKRKRVILPLTTALGLVWFTVLLPVSAIANSSSLGQSNVLSKQRKPVFQTGIPGGGRAGTPTRAVPDAPIDTNNTGSPGQSAPKPEGRGVRPQKPAVDPRIPHGEAGAPKRGTCLQGENPKPLMALLPLSELNRALTTSVHPTFYVYVPPRIDTKPTAKFKLIDNKGVTIFQTNFALGNKSGVMGLQLPETATPLLLEQDYQWEFTLVCDPGDPESGTLPDSAANLKVGAWVRRIKLDPVLTLQFSKATLEEKAELYAQQGVWHDLLATMAKLQLEEPENAQLSQYWVDLLSQDIVDLQTVANEPVLPVQVLVDPTQLDSLPPISW